ncbi:MAG TPA: hypothetical protein VGO47_08405 [Chlamydiales bacterium]|jgi:hypothetical protein|nr:hypothetical protein [Chlamydiales bacterium]
MDRCVFGPDISVEIQETKEEETQEEETQEEETVASMIALQPKPPKSTIPKPHGERGKPQSGGYSLAEQLGWSAKEYKEAQVLPLMLQGLITDQYLIEIL